MGSDAIASSAPETPDAELMARLVGGDDLALNLIMDRWKARIAAFLFRRTGLRDVAIDLTQETFVKLYQARLRYRPTGEFSTYLFAIAANLARNHVRWTQRHPTVSMDEPDAGGVSHHEAHDPRPTPDRAYTAAETEQVVHRAFKALPDDLCEAISLFLHEDMSYADIAHIAGCSQKAVETRIYRARQLLKEQLKGLRDGQTLT